VLILILLLVSFITVTLYVDYPISLTRLCFIAFFVTVGLYRIDRHIDLFSCTAATVLNKLTNYPYLLTYYLLGAKPASYRVHNYKLITSDLMNINEYHRCTTVILATYANVRD